jgi:exodeoxyribonuclease VII large subunit
VVKPDVILVARGGGSLEDLWAFNDERVVRAVAASQVPVISGVGHETDFTLTDFAADLRAPTPTGAAVLAVPNISDLAAELNGWTLRLQQNVLEALSRSSMVLNEKAHRLERQSPLWQVRQDRQYLDGLSQRLQLHINHDLQNRRSTLIYFGERLTGLDPVHILRRGYALVKDSTGSLITSTKQVKLGQDIAVQLVDGSLDAQVQQVHSEEG